MELNIDWLGNFSGPGYSGKISLKRKRSSVYWLTHLIKALDRMIAACRLL
jgi:hypothetical protein